MIRFSFLLVMIYLSDNLKMGFCINSWPKCQDKLETQTSSTPARAKPPTSRHRWNHNGDDEHQPPEKQ